MKPLSRRAAQLAGVALILLTNAVALGGVWWNRSGDPDSVLALSERELRLETRPGSENSGLALALQWRAVPPDDPEAAFGARTWADRTTSPAWLDRDKMQALGFARAPESDEPHAKRDRGREVFIVLELDGPAYQALRTRLHALAEREIALLELDPQNEEFARRAQHAREYLADEGQRSRLFAVDAGLHRAELRADYPDRSRYAIVRAEIAPMYRAGKADGPQGFIRNVRPGIIHLPFAHRAGFEFALEASAATRGKLPAFTAELAFGKRLEPWLRDIRLQAAP